MVQVIKHLFEVAHIEFNEDLLTHDGWRNKYVWSEQERSDFSDWMFQFLKDNKEARKEYMKIPVSGDKHIRRAVNRFLNEYGWKTNYDITRSENRRG